MELHENLFNEKKSDFDKESLKKLKSKFKSDVREVIGKELREAYLRMLNRQYNDLLDKYLRNQNKSTMTNESFLSQSSN